MSNSSIYQDPARSVTERVDDLLAQMTLDEKIAQLGSYWVYEIADNAQFSTEKAGKLMAHGVGQITRMGGASNVRPQESARLANSIQRYMIENTRLGIPAVIHEECCSGYMAFGATVFPQAIGVASTWSPELTRAMADVIRVQMRSVGAHQALAPLLDVARDARWGRVEETFGEDPYLTASLGSAYVRGIQGADLASGVVATGKHFVGYAMSEGGLNWAPPHIAPRELREVYLYPFEAAVRESGLASIMNGYHELDGVPCGGSRKLLTEILRDEWGFDGTVVSDYFAVNMLHDYHHVTGNKAEAAHLALDAGIDVELPHTDCYGDPLRQAAQNGDIPEALIDQAVRRVLVQKFALGLFENPYVDEGAVNFDTAAQRQLARQIAEKSIVLLRNEGVLPLTRDLASVAVIGPNADSVRNLFGDYAYPAHIETILESMKKENVFNNPLPDSLQSVEDFIPTSSVLQALRDKVGANTQVSYAKGCDILGDSTEGFAEAVEAARSAQVAVVVVGDKAGLTDDCTSGEARDRATLDLPGVQAQLVKAVYDTGTPVVLVLMSGRPVSLGWIADSVPAILEAWFPGEEGANAIASVLFGDVNPGGKLPITFPRTVGQVPTFYSHPPSGGRSHWKGDYVETSVQPLYPFGYGLSYTRFAYANLRVEPQTARVGDDVTVSIDVTNVGDRAGDEVVQVYTHQLVTGVTRPVKQLRAFRRVTLAAGETQTVAFRVAVSQLGFYDLNERYVVAPGMVDVMVGSSSRDIHATGSFVITSPTTEVTDKAYFSQDV